MNSENPGQLTEQLSDQLSEPNCANQLPASQVAPAGQISRRQCLGVFTAASASAALAATKPRTATAIEPQKNVPPAKHAFSLAAYSYRTLLQSKTDTFTLFDFIDDCAAFGLDGTELTSYYFQKPCTDEYLRSLKRHCFRRGVDISGTAIACDFGVPLGAKRNAEIAQVKQWIDRAEILGAPVIRIFAGHVPKDQSVARTHELIVEGIHDCCRYAAQHGVHLALENHGGPTATADGLLKIVREVDSDWFGVNLDTGNFHSDDVYAEIAQAAPYAINVQVKVVTSGPDKKKRPADFGRIAQILRDVNYHGYVVLEYEEAGDPREESRRFADQMRAAFS